MKRQCLAALAALALALALPRIAHAETAVSVSHIVARQRYPWNGLVDITCTVAGIDGETNGLALAVAAVLPDTGRARSVKHFQIVRDGEDPDDREVCTNGTYQLLWDAAADLGPVRYTNLVVRVTFDAHKKVQLWENGPYWATENLGAEKPWEYGLYFWWGDTVGYRREGDAWVANDGSSQDFQFYYDPIGRQTYGKTSAMLESEGWVVSKDGTTVLAPEHDAAQVQWGGGWRMPTDQELSDLNSKCDWTWTSQNGVSGYAVRGRGAHSDASIFLPAAGSGFGTSLNDAGSYGFYWSSVPSSDNLDAYELYFHSSYHGAYNSYRYDGFSVRPVQGFAK